MKFDFAIRPKKKLRPFRLKIKKNFFLSFIGEIKNAARIFHNSPHDCCAFQVPDGLHIHMTAVAPRPKSGRSLCGIVLSIQFYSC